MNFFIINIYDIGLGVDGVLVRKVEFKLKFFWKFNRFVDVGSSNEVEAVENESEVVNVERKGESRESILEFLLFEILLKKE